MADELTTEEIFESAVNIIKNLPKDGPIQPSNGMKLKFYAYFKQATHGPNNTRKPSFYQVVEGYKWEAWHRLGEMSKEEAMMSYINELKQSMNSLPQIDIDVSEKEKFENVLGRRQYNYWFNQWKESEASGTTDHAIETESTYEDALSNADFRIDDEDENYDTLRQTLIRETTMALIRLQSSLIALGKHPPRTI